MICVQCYSNGGILPGGIHQQIQHRENPPQQLQFNQVLEHEHIPQQRQALPFEVLLIRHPILPDWLIQGLEAAFKFFPNCLF